MVRRSFGFVLALLLLAPLAQAEERKVQSLGVAGIRPGDAVDAARQNAVRYGINQAVYRVVADELPALDAEQAYGVGRRLFRNETRNHVTRFRVVEDRGTRPRQATTLANATHEYVVLIEADVAVDSIRKRLVREGLLAGGGQTSLRRVRLTLEELPGYAAYEQVRLALVDRLQAQSAVPVEFTARRVVVEVVTRDPAGRLLSRLVATPLEGVRLQAIEAGDRRARARVLATP